MRFSRRCFLPFGPARVIVAIVTVGFASVFWTTAARAQYRAPEWLTKTEVTLPVRGQSSAGSRASGQVAPGQVIGGQPFRATLTLAHLFELGSAKLTLQLQSTTGPLAASRRLQLRLFPVERHLGADQALGIEVPVEFPQGQSVITIERLFPKWSVGDTFVVELVEDGLALPGYSTEVGSPLPGYALQNPVSVLPSDVRLDVLLIETEAEMPPPAPIRTPVVPEVLCFWRSLPPAALPSDWRLLRDVDCIAVAFSRLEQLTAESTDAVTKRQWDAVRDWVLMGGCLLVLESPDTSTLETTLGVTLLSTPEEQLGTSEDRIGYLKQVNAVAKDARGTLQAMDEWFEARLEQASGSSEGVPRFAPARVSSDSLLSGEMIQATEAWLQQQHAYFDQFQAAWLAGQGYQAGGGLVIGLPGKAIHAPHAFDVLHRLADYRVSTTLTRAIDPLMGSGRNSRWLIPGVAEPPVYTFISILTLFVLLVGPVAYRWTTRGHRSHLMFLIAPTLAALTTVSMFTYSILADGFGTKGRVRQITWVDGRSGHAVERTWMTLFAGISPREGLDFDADAEVLPYPGGGTHWKQLPHEIRDVRTVVTVDGQTQHFSGSALPSRTQAQFISHRVRHQLGRLTIGELAPFDSADPESVNATLTLENSFPFELRGVVARSDDGRYWMLDSIAAGAREQAAWVADSLTVSNRLGELLNAYPLKQIGTVSGNSQRGQQIRDLVSYLNQQVRVGSTQHEGFFEDWLVYQLRVKSELPPGVFIGICAPSADVIPVQGCELFDSVRYVMGTLK